MTEGDDRGRSRGYSVDDAYRVLAGLPPLDAEPADAEPADEATGYTRDEAYRILRGLPPRPGPPGDRA